MRLLGVVAIIVVGSLLGWNEPVPPPRSTP